MIVVKLIGGLGNQMFQCAAGKALAIRHGVELRLDLSALEENAGEHYTRRHFSLNVFETEFLPATNNDKQKFLEKKENRLLRVVQRKLPFLFGTVYIAESGSAYHKEFRLYPPDTYLDGFWQSERYFKDCETQIRNDFRFNTQVVKQAQDWTKKVQSTPSVSVHVRRGDYVANAGVNQYHGLCSPDYYKRAVASIQEKAGATELFVFSDDLDWCRQHLQFDLPMYFVDLGDAATELLLMSQCKHNIIANSSFSWWGAWLNDNKEKMVVVPEYWFAGKKSIDLDIKPEKWRVL